MAFNIYRWQESTCRARQRAQEFRNETCTAILDLVHVDNLGPLPPAPRMLERKAISMGLITLEELIRKHNFLID